MSKIVVFGAGGRAGRHAIAEAVRRGHQVTAVVRDPSRHHDLAESAVTVVSGDVTNEESVATVAENHVAAINAAARMDVSSKEFYVSAAHALLNGLARAGVGRLLCIGIGTTLQTAPGVLVHDAPGFPAEGRAFSLGHLAELEVLTHADTMIDWLVVTPPPTVLDDSAPGSGHYRVATNVLVPAAEGAPPFSYADLATAVIDQIDKPTHHRTQIAVAY